NIYDFSLGVGLAHLQILALDKTQIFELAEQSRHTRVRARIGAEVGQANFEEASFGRLAYGGLRCPMNSILVYENIRLGPHFFRKNPGVFQSFEGLLVHHKLLRNLVPYRKDRKSTRLNSS